MLGADGMRSRLLDAHALIRADDAARYPFAPLGPPLELHEREQGTTAAQLLEALDAQGVERAILVQRGRLYGYDNRYVCDSAAAHPRRLQFVCQVDPSDPDCARRTQEWIRRGAAGVRFMEPVKGATLAWLDGAGARNVWRVACEAGVPIGAHFFPWNRAAGLELLARLLSELLPRALVLDGLAGSAVDAGPPDFGIDAPLRTVMAFPCTYLKLTTMTLMRLAAAKLAASALLRRLAELFGTDRLLWGSDVLAPGQRYESAVALCLEASAGLAPRDRERLLHGTAAALYPLR